MLEDNYVNAKSFVNKDLPEEYNIRYLAYDMKTNLKRDKEEFL